VLNSKNPAQNKQIKERLSSLKGSNILIAGSAALKKSLLRDLEQAGVGKFLFFDGNDSDAPWSITNLEKSVRQANVVIDALTDWQQKIALSDVCMDCEIGLVHCGITGFRFQIYTMIPLRSACLRCALPLAGMDEIPISPNQDETIEPVIELAAAWQSLEAIKYLTRIGVVQGNELFKFDCLSGELEIIRGLDAKPDCPDCGRNNSPRLRR
jgi:molybdopterin/thiamine biosynthesis adenylyltransferase